MAQQKWIRGGFLEIDVKTDTKRTLTQNKAMHKYYELLASALNDAGFSVQMVLTKPLEISWSPNLIKELIWRRVQEALLNKDSTADLTSSEVSEIYMEVDRAVSQQTGVSVSFPEDERKKWPEEVIS